MNDRLKFIDIAKAIGIICVCIGHSGTSTFIVTAVMMFQMPLFYFISGYLYKDFYSEHPFIRIKKSIKAYYLPFLAYDIGYLVLHNIFALLHLVDAKNGGGLLGISLVLVIASFGWFQNNKYLIQIGKCSLEIIELHFLAFKIVSLIIIIIYRLPVTRLSDYPVIETGGLWWICYTLVGVCVPVILKLAAVRLQGRFIRGERT